MKLLYRVLRFLAVIILCVAVVLPAITYVGLSLTPVQRRIADRCEVELSRLLGIEVTIGGLGIIPFNRVVLRDVAVTTAPGDTALKVRQMGAGVRLWSLVTDDPMTVTYVELIGMDARLHRDSIGAPLNIAPIIEALKPKKPWATPTLFDLKVNTVLLRASRVRYDVDDEEFTPGRFNPNHIDVSNLRADLRLPRIKNDDFSVSVKRMGCREQSGLQLDNLTVDASINNDSLHVGNFALDMPASRLAIADFTLALNGINSIAESLRRGSVDLAVIPGSYLSTSDFTALLPVELCGDVTVDFNRCEINGNVNDFTADASITAGDIFRIEAEGHGRNAADRARRHITLDRFVLNASGNEALALTDCKGAVKENLRNLVARLANVKLTASGTLDGNAVNLDADIETAAGGLALMASGKVEGRNDLSLEAELTTTGPVALDAITGNQAFGEVEGTLTANASIRGNRRSGEAVLDVERLQFRGADYTDVEVRAELADDIVSGRVAVDNDAVALALEGAWSLARTSKLVELRGKVDRFVPSELNLWNKYPGGNFAGAVDIALSGDRLDKLTGSAALTEVGLTLPEGESFTLHSLAVNADSTLIELRSDYIDGSLTGIYDFRTLPKVGADILSHVFPALTGPGLHREFDDNSGNDFTFRFTIKETEKPAEFFHLPVSVIYPVEITGALSDATHDMGLTIDAPYLRQGTKLIENTRLSLAVTGADGVGALDFTTTAPTKNGQLTLVMDNSAKNDCLTSGLTWKINRAKAYDGNVRAVTTFAREENNRLVTNINLLPGQLTFNDSTWHVNPAKITVDGPKHIVIDGLNVHRNNQFVKIDGVAAEDEDSTLVVDLRNFSLDYLFESLGIDKVMLGGDASGVFNGSALLSGNPILSTPGLNVTAISYNKVVLGDALVKSRWDGERRAVTLDAVINQPDGRQSVIDGAIFPLDESLDITFNCDHVNVGFMQPYMEAFASDITGHASGRARLWGTFKYIDLEGDVFADDLRLKVNFTNTYYTARDSVHFRPGLIDLNGITIRDAEGHTANLNGWVKHKFFKEPRFEFSLTDAHDFLAYNETPRENPVWYGKIYGTGSASVKGWPGRVDISVDMATAPRSTFTFVLSDQEVADEYSFLTFRDKGKLSAQLTDTVLLQRDTSMDLVNRLRELVDAHNTDTPSDYNISLQMRVTPDAQIVLVMDPVGGDRIRAYGSGHLRMDYGSANNDLKMYGTYTLDRGDYNFTLQDVIIKDFTIKNGSEIVFNGDPYGAQLNIQAVYALNANLSDLDESFLQDKDLNRTNVPVHALMKVNGDIRQPEITFDLEFPTLTTDIYRKVRSIISTDDMMNRQIIYLLALNRFYTPEYMTSTTKGNELVSVASSTISSQLSNMLGQISDNWNIAPTFRSDRGDFSDVEVDVALSSRLLNNRLLFNGNFGYRDNSLNANQFVGDFDLEYILDREGMWRLKAYNRYNDQNYYLRTATTTQGVGVVLKRDFDSFFSFLKAFRKKNSKQPTQIPLKPGEANDSTAVK